MYRKFVITDEEDKTLEFTLSENETMKVTQSEIIMTLTTKQWELTMIDAICKFMGGNSINKIEVEELEGEAP